MIPLICLSSLQIFKLLQRESEFKIGHVCIAGSIGKKTTISDSDIDCVLFINGEMPPFDDVLDFENILNLTDSYDIRDVRKTKYSIQFKSFDFDFDFDILPAVNFTRGLQSNSDTLIYIQQRRVLQRIKKDPERNGYSYSSSLANATIRFMVRKNSFVKQMVRIAKFW